MNELDFLKKLHDNLLEHSAKLTFDKEHPWHRNLVALHGSLIELGGALIILLSGDGKIGVPSVFRTILETYVEFHNLLKDKTYGYHMEAQYNEQWLKLLKEGSKGTNPYLRYFEEVPDLAKEIAKMEKELEELKSQGYNPLRVWERFEKADMLNEYTSIYNMLSTDTHGNIRALINRHIDIKGTDFNVVYYKDEPTRKFLLYIEPSLNILVRSAIGIHELLKSEVLSEVKLLETELEEWRKKYIDDKMGESEGKSA